MTFHSIIFLFAPAKYLMLLIVFILPLYWKLFNFRNKQVSKYTSTRLQARMMVSRSPMIFWGKTVAICLVWILIVFALMQPCGYGSYANTQQMSVTAPRMPPHEVVLLVDSSSSMNVKDARDSKSRLSYAKESADAIVDRLEGEFVSLQAFTSEVNQMSPLTTDYLFVRLMLKEMSINEGGAAGTDLKSALKAVHKQFLSHRPQVIKSLIILSDGEDPNINALDEPSQKKEREAILQLLKDSEKNNYRVYTIGIGSKEGGVVPDILFEGKPVHSSLAEDFLRQISTKGRGKYYDANHSSSIEIANSLLREFAAQESKVAKATDPTEGINQTLIQKQYYQIPLGLAILFFIGIVSFPDTWEQKYPLNKQQMNTQKYE